MNNLKIVVFQFLLLSCISTSAQHADSLNYEPYRPGFPFQEGIYLNFQEFKLNRPSITTSFEGRGNELRVFDDSLQQMIPVYADKVWGYSQAGNIYIARDNAFWRIINIGSLAQYSAIVVTRFTTTDQFGFPVENYTKSMKSLFMDMSDGTNYELDAKNLKPYIESEPEIGATFKKKSRRKARELLLIIKAYNELNPIYFPTYE